jgi:hypothetical protein
VLDVCIWRVANIVPVLNHVCAENYFFSDQAKAKMLENSGGYNCDFRETFILSPSAAQTSSGNWRVR